MKNRIDRVLERMEKKGIEQLLISDPRSIRFLTGVYIEPFERLFALILRTNGKHTMLLNYLFYLEKETGFEEVWFGDLEDQIEIIANNIDPNKTLGVDKNWPARFLIPLQEKLPQLKTVWGSDCVDGVRACKDEEEVKIMKEASKINDEVMLMLPDFIKEGMTEAEVAAFIDNEYLKRGCTGVAFPTIVCFGENAADQHHEPSETRKLKAGECILIDMGCRWKGYCSDMTRTFYCKSADPEQIKAHDATVEAVKRAEALVAPGVPICDIDKAARDYMDKFGYTKYWTNRLGHFIGQEDHEYGDVSPLNKNVCEPGMIFSIEPGVYIAGKYGVRVEDLVLVTEDGCELLNHVDKKYQIIG